MDHRPYSHSTSLPQVTSRPCKWLQMTSDVQTQPQVEKMTEQSAQNYFLQTHQMKCWALVAKSVPIPLFLNFKYTSQHKLSLDTIWTVGAICKEWNSQIFHKLQKPSASQYKITQIVLLSYKRYSRRMSANCIL